MKSLSIIIPVYNPEQSVFNRCISSILNTSDFNDVEIIIVDDCSDDTSYQDYLNSLNIEIKIIQNDKNLGQGLTRQKGLDNASGEYVTFVDQDDEFYGYNIFKDVLIRDGEISFYLRTPMLVVDSLGHSWKIYDDNTLHGMFYRRSILEDHNVHFSSEIRNYEDLYFMAQLGSITYHENLPISESDEMTYTWYLWEGSQSHRKGDGVYLIETYDEFLQVQEEMIDRNLSKYGYDEYLKERFKLFALDLYFTCMRYPVLEEKVLPYILKILNKLGLKIEDLRDMLKDPVAYVDCLMINAQRIGPCIPNKTLSQFITEI